MTKEEIKKDLEYRAKNFAIEWRKSHTKSYYPGEKILSVTHNGFQWISISLLPHEAKAVIKALK